MRHSVITPAYIFRKMLDDILYSLCPTKHMSVATLGPLLSRIPFSAHEPSGWIPLYTMVTFRPDISYAMAKKKAQRQSRVVSSIGWVGTTFFGITFLGITWVALSRRLRSQGWAWDNGGCQTLLGRQIFFSGNFWRVTQMPGLWQGLEYYRCYEPSNSPWSISILSHHGFGRTGNRILREVINPLFERTSRYK